MRFVKTPANLFLLAAVLLITSSLMQWNKIADIHFFNANFHFYMRYFNWTFAVFFIVLALFYKIAYKQLQNEKLIFAHLVLTFLSLIISFSVISAEHFIPKPADRQLLIAGISFLAGQICFIMNLLSGAMKKH